MKNRVVVRLDRLRDAERKKNRRVCRWCEERYEIEELGTCIRCRSLAADSLDSFARPYASSPTTAPPGSPEKIKVLMERANTGKQLFHPLDNRDVVKKENYAKKREALEALLELYGDE